MSTDREASNPPCNFSWVVDNKLAAMAGPGTTSNVRYIIDQGIKHLVTLSPEKRPPIHSFPELEWTEIAVEEFEPPTLYQIQKFIDICECCIKAEKPVGIHCRMGRGRTGVMAACYMVHFCNLSPDRALTNLRQMRPGSVETYGQEKIVRNYYDFLRTKNP